MNNKILYIDCSMGAAGDMLAGALLELMPEREATLCELNAMGIPGVEFLAEAVTKCSIGATHLSVRVHGEEEGMHHDHHHHHDHDHHHHHAHRSLEDILQIISTLNATQKAKTHASEIYRSLAEAESKAHGRSVGEVHFHEVGALDAIADIMATCVLMEKIGAEKIVSSSINVGGGSVQCAHGEVPVPAPATEQLLTGLPTYGDGEILAELCTPTGAALVRHFATGFGPRPPMRTISSGRGAGRADFKRANYLVATLGEGLEMEGEGEICELRFNVDDMTGEELAFAAERICASGAKDVSYAAVTMKKGRPGVMAFVICAVEDRDRVLEAIFAHTSTIGVRESVSSRYVLKREIEEVEVGGHERVRRKIARGYGVEKAKWEADDIERLARAKGMTIKETIKEIEKKLEEGEAK